MSVNTTHLTPYKPYKPYYDGSADVGTKPDVIVETHGRSFVPANVFYEYKHLVVCKDNVWSDPPPSQVSR